MSQPAQLIICGAGGRMGRLMTAMAHAREDCRVIGAIEAPGSDLLGMDIGSLAGIGEIGVPVTDDLAAVAASGTVVLDFTIADAARKNVPIAIAAGAAVLLGTSGLSHEEREEIKHSAKGIPMIIAANTSVGVNVLLSLVEDAVRRAGPEFDLELFEIHHNRKKDSPSGTAVAIAEAAAEARGLDPATALRTSREGMVGERPRDEIGVFGLRGGDNAGEHTLYIVGAGERIELTHRTASRDCLAAGAVRAAAWLAGKEPGLYSMLDVID